MVDRQGLQQLLDDTARYVSEALATDLHLRPCGDSNLPPYLQSAYQFACGSVLGVKCVFMVNLSEGRAAPASLARQMARVKDLLALPAVYVAPDLRAYQRKRLVAQAVPFVVPFTQLYLPPLGVDFREAARNRAVEAPELLKPVTQVVLLHALLRRSKAALDAQSAVEELGYSPISISRAFRDLEAAGLAIRWTEGRSRPLSLSGAKRDVWERAQPRLVSPVRSRYLVPEEQLAGALEAGLTALARYSMISAPSGPTVAMSSESWRRIKKRVPVEPFSPSARGEPGQMVVEVWTYPPAALAEGPTVDILSLALSLRDEPDERVEAALVDALENLPW
ncbi:MAG: hypothetical protein WD314_15420 [Trueperaceae bacterium]